MTKEEIFEERRKVCRKLCEEIRENDGQLVNAKYFLKRPYSDGARSYKFSSANYLRLLASDKKVISESDPRWISVEEIKNNGWTLNEKAEPELLEVWTKTCEPECCMIGFYNGADVVEKGRFRFENQSLERVIEFLQERGLVEVDAEIISLQDTITAIKKYAERFEADELTTILTVQTWMAESRLKTRMKSFLPTYPETILTELEKNPDKLFVSMNKALEILKNLRREKIKTLQDKIRLVKPFGDLKIIYHGSEGELENKNGMSYPKESILTGVTAYEFLRGLQATSLQKFWLEISYKDYAHGKIVLTSEDFDVGGDKSISTIFKKRLEQNRRRLLNNPQELRKYMIRTKEIRAEELLQEIRNESRQFELVMAEFGQEENIYLNTHTEFLIND